MDNNTTMVQTLSHFILTELTEDLDVLEGDDNLLMDGMVDSLGMVRLVGFIEETFAYSVPPEDFVVNNFQTLDAICAYLRRGQT